MIDVIQSAAAIYVLAVVAWAVGASFYAAWTHTKIKGNLTGYPMVVLMLAMIICAVTTIGAVT